MAKAKKTNGRAKTQKADNNFDLNGVRSQATHFVARMQDGLRDAGEAQVKETQDALSKWIALATKVSS